MSYQSEDRIAGLEATVSFLIEKMSTMVPKTSESRHDWENFRDAVIRKIGRDKGWQHAFIEGTKYASGDLKYKCGDLVKWRKTNIVPDVAFESISNISVGNIAKLFSSHKNLSYSVLAKIVCLKRRLENTGGDINLKIAKILSLEYGRTFTIGSVKSAGHRAEKYLVTRQITEAMIEKIGSISIPEV